MPPRDLGLSADERKAYNYLYSQADKEDLGVLTGDKAVAFFEGAGLPGQTLGEIWALSDDENTGFLTKEAFAGACRLIGHAQAGTKPRADLLTQVGPVAYFRGFMIPGLAKQPSAPTQSARTQTSTSPAPGRAAPSSSPAPRRIDTESANITITPDERARYVRIFSNAGPVGGLLDGEKASDILGKSQLSNDKLSQVWNLSDRQQRGALDMSDFIIAMALIQACIKGTITRLPNVVPASLASQVGPPNSLPQMPSSPLRAQSTGLGSLTPQRTGQSMPLRQSTLSQSTTGAGGQAWSITPVEKAQSDTFFAMLDTSRSGFITGDIAVPFFTQSGLGEDVLAQIWDLSDIQKRGRLNQDEFAVARRLIMDALAGKAVPLALDIAMMPPSLRGRRAAPQSEVQRDLFSLMDDDDTSAPASPQTQAFPTAFAPPRVASPTQMSPLRPMHTGGSSRSITVARSNIFPPVQPLAPNVTGNSLRASTPQLASRAAPPPVPAVRSALASPALQNRQADLFADAAADEPEVLSSPTAEQRSEVNNLQTQVAATQRSVSTLRDQRTKQSKEAEDIEKQIEEFKLALSQAKAAYDVESTNMTNLEVRHKTGNDELKKLREQTITAESDLSALREQKIELEQSILKDKEEMREINRKLKVTNEEVEALRQDHERLKKDIRQQKGLLVVHRKQLSTAEGQRETAQSDITNATRELSETKAELATAGEQAAASVAPAAALLHEQARHVALPHSEVVSPVPSVASARSTNPFERKGAFSPALMAAGGAGIGLAAAAAVNNRSKSPLMGGAADHHTQAGDGHNVSQGQDVDEDPFGADSSQYNSGHAGDDSVPQVAKANDFGFDDDFDSAFGPSKTLASAQSEPVQATSVVDFDDAFSGFDNAQPAADQVTRSAAMYEAAAPVTRDFATESQPASPVQHYPSVSDTFEPAAAEGVTFAVPGTAGHAFGTPAEQPYESREAGESDDGDVDDLPPIRDIEPQEDSDSDVERDDDSQHGAPTSFRDSGVDPAGSHVQHALAPQDVDATAQADTSLPGAYPTAGSDTEDAFVDALHTHGSVHTMSPQILERSAERTAYGEVRHTPFEEAPSSGQIPSSDHVEITQQVSSSAVHSAAHSNSAPAGTAKAIDDFDDFKNLTPARVESITDATPSTSAPTSAVPVTVASAGLDDAFDDDFGFDKQTFSKQSSAPAATSSTASAPTPIEKTTVKPAFDADFDDAFGLPQAAPPLPKRPAIGFDDDFFSSPLPSSTMQQPATNYAAPATSTAPAAQNMSYMVPPPGSPPRLAQTQSAFQPPAMPPRQPSSKPMSRDEALQELTAMGFSQRQAQSALEDNQYDVSRAANALLAVNM